MSRLGLRRCRPFVLMAMLLSLAVLGSTAPHASAATSAVDAPDVVPSGPILTSAAATSPELGTIVVAGQDFTPGGRVYVALYDQWAVTRYPAGWVTASAVAYGQDGSRDPAAGFSPGGTILVPVQHLCGANALVRAYDKHLARWSNWLDVSPGC